MLLPTKNFRSKTLVSDLMRLSKVDFPLPGESEIISVFKSAKRSARFSTTGANSFLDDKGMKFHTPGRAIHGGHHISADVGVSHPDRCSISAYARLGVRINPGFHYDCTSYRPTANGKFLGCHGQSVDVRKHTHINVYVNDFLRCPKK